MAIATLPVVTGSCGPHHPLDAAAPRESQVRVGRSGAAIGFPTPACLASFIPLTRGYRRRTPRYKLGIVFLCIIALVTACSMLANQAKVATQRQARKIL